MNKLYLILLTGICICFINLSCDKEDIDGNGDNNKPVELTIDEKSVVASNNEFSFELFRELNNQDESENIFISPLSIGMALAMTYNGADGQTKVQMGEVLGFENVGDSSLNLAYKGVYDALMNSDDKVEISLANSIWYKQEYTVNVDFSDIVNNYYDAVINPINTSDPNSKDIINNWVEEKTNDKIKNLVKEVSPADVMFLVNAIYFNSDWTYIFNKDETTESDFIKENGITVKCQMMKVNEINILSYQDEDFSLIELPYSNKQYGMVIILPSVTKTVDEIISLLTVNELNNILEDTSKSKMTVYMPKFKVEYEIKLNDVLIAMGMSKAFDGSAEFPYLFEGISDGLYIDRVRHKSFIEVDEEGTEAAAATVVVIREFSALENNIWLNRPFIYLIRENNTGAILFMGKLTDPIL